jgi:hypothetical protein
MAFRHQELIRQYMNGYYVCVGTESQLKKAMQNNVELLKNVSGRYVFAISYYQQQHF